MGYELRALIGRLDALQQVASDLGEVAGPLRQGLGLLPITDEALDRIGGFVGEDRSSRDGLWFLSRGLEQIARRASSACTVAYIEVDLFGGNGTQAAMAWSGDRCVLGPVVTKFGWPPPSQATRPEWAVNRALRQLGVDRGDCEDEFDAVELGGRRHTSDWLQSRGGALVPLPSGW